MKRLFAVLAVSTGLLVSKVSSACVVTPPPGFDNCAVHDYDCGEEMVCMEWFDIWADDCVDDTPECQPNGPAPTNPAGGGTNDNSSPGGMSIQR